MIYSELLKKIWNSIYDPNADIFEIIEKYFHEDFEQCINGVVMNRAQYTQHVINQKQNMTITAIEYKHIVENGNEMFALYYPKGRNKKELPIEGEVIAYFRFENQQIYAIHGLVRLTMGDLADVDMKNH